MHGGEKRQDHDFILV